MRRMRVMAGVVLVAFLAAGCVSSRGGGGGGERVPSGAIPSAGGAPFRTLIAAPLYLQKDPAWAGDPMGGSYETVGSAGCTLCCVAMYLSSRGYAADPKTLNAALSANGGYTSSGLLIWEKCSAFTSGWVRVAYVGRPDYGIIDANLRRGNPVIVKILLGERYTHWVLIVGKDGPEYLVHDPAAGVAPLPLRPRSRYMYALRVLEPIENLPPLKGLELAGEPAEASSPAEVADIRR